MYTVALPFLLCILHANGHKDYQTRIVGGKTASPGTFPFVVSLRYFQDFCYIYLCSGSIIHQQWVLTAAHCVFERQRGMIFNSKNVANIVVVAGINKLNQLGSTHLVSKIHTHPDYHKTLEIIRNDLALLQLDEPFEYSKTIQPITLGYYTDRRDHEVLALGFGHMYGGMKGLEKRNNDLRYLLLKTVETKKCKSIHAKVGNYVDDLMHICAFAQEGNSLCHGDSGGPLVDYPTGLQVGVFSGLQDCSGVYPALYTNLKQYLPWIGNLTTKAKTALY